jgi:hypothetical protein
VHHSNKDIATLSLGFAQNPRGTSFGCDAVLIPQVAIENSTKEEQVAWLSLITQETYQSAQASGGIQAVLPFLSAGASFDQFQEARTKFFQEQQLNYSDAEARAILRQFLTPDQTSAWLSCIENSATGVRILLHDDSETGVTCQIFYTGQPGSSLRFNTEIHGGTSDGRSKFGTDSIGSGGVTEFFIDRESSDKVIYILVSGHSLADSAVSFPPPIPPKPPQACIDPTLLSRGAPVVASANQGGAVFVTDGSTDTIWNSEAFPPQFVEITLPQPSLLHHVVLTAEQNPSCPTTHEIFGTKSSGEAVLIGTLDTITTAGGQYQVVILPPNTGSAIQKVKVLTTKSQSWVAWREIEIWGCATTGFRFGTKEEPSGKFHSR